MRSHTILVYFLHWVNDLRIFDDYESKFSTELPDYSEGTPTFQGFLLVVIGSAQCRDADQRPVCGGYGQIT